ncbi:MAG: ligase-associated DNA damage response exonuclease [Gammaproteobacteria bacterium]|nr:ligase-associated DNA damage response exonuclease [Gammaproteobacteria bacterium]
MTGRSRAPLLVWTERGLYCPPGAFHIDPAAGVPCAVVTHAHGDHLRPGSARYVLASVGAGVARLRLGDKAGLETVEYGAVTGIGDTRVSLHPAGHILGSAQVRIEHAGEVWVVSGDFKRAADPTCRPFEPIECDVFVSEATFARPVYRWPPGVETVAEIVRWWHANRERGITSVLFCYALGKTQRVLAELLAFTSDPVHVHEALAGPIRAYRDAGVPMVPTLPAPSASGRQLAGALVLAPPGAARGRWMRRFGEASTGLCSGWMQLRSNRRQSGHDRGFVLSDHADWPALVDTIARTRAPRVLLMHGHTATLVRFLREERGVDAAPLGPGSESAA